MFLQSGLGNIFLEFIFEKLSLYLVISFSQAQEVHFNLKKQDGNVPSRRHILGSKIFKEQLLEKFGNFFFQKKSF